MKETFANLTKPGFIVPAAIVAVLTVYLYNTYVAPKLSEKLGRDVTA